MVYSVLFYTLNHDIELILCMLSFLYYFVTKPFLHALAIMIYKLLDIFAYMQVIQSIS